MREVKFRAWDNQLKQMITSSTSMVIRLSGKVTDGSTTPDVNLMQFTGLRDKNGVEIYEGDIIRNERQDWGVIVFNAPFFEVTVSETQSSLYSREWLSACKVIGNIHENPELLESK